jgi:hypothetical protein
MQKAEATQPGVFRSVPERRTSMRFSPKALAIAGAIVWGGAILLVGMINLAMPAYGTSFLQMTSSVYPWFHVSRTIGSVAIGTVSGLVDGAVAGLIFALLYNVFASTPTTPRHP